MAMIESRTYSSKSERLRQHLLEEMAAGRLSASEPLPSENALAASFGVCRNTVRRAFGELERAGIIRRIRGKGTFLRSGPMRLTVSSQQPTRLQPTESGPLAVSSQQMQAYALLLPEVRRSLYPSLIRGFGRAAAESTRPRQVLVCQTENDIYRQADIVLQMLDRHVAGVALVPTTVAPTPAYHVSQLQAAGVAVVLCHRPVVGAAAPCVSWDWHEVGRLAAKALLERGHRRIAFVSSSRYAVPEAYEAGLRAGLEAGGAQLPREWVYYGDLILHRPEPSTASGPGQALQRMLEQAGKAPPTAVFCNDDPCAEEVYLWAVDHGLRIPQDLSILCAGDSEREGAISKRLACVTIGESRLGQRAAELLEQINSGLRAMNDQERVNVPLDLSVGETLGSI